MPSKLDPAAPTVAAAPRAQPLAVLWICVAALLVVTTVAFSPTFNAELLSWDDESYVSTNKLLREPAGLKVIWDPSSTQLSQYYPLLFTSYWVQYQLWGANSTGYHVVNLALHLINVVLVLRLMQALGASAWVAFATAAIFALHPTQVASVAWVAEQKNTLSGCFYLIAFLLFLHHRRTGSGGAYAGALAAFLAALLSKTQTLTLPISILVADWLLQRQRRLPQVGVVPVAFKLAPMLALDLVAVAITTYAERQGVGVAAFRLPGAGERPFIAAAAPWFYVSKLLLPINLSPIYAKWKVSAADPKYLLAVVASPVAVAAVIKWRERIGPLALWGLAQFGIALVPVLGLIPFGYQQHTLVADHYLYLAIIGAALVLAVAADHLAGSGAWTGRRQLVTALGVLVCGAYAVQSHRESQHWHDTPTFWQRVLEHDPDSFAGSYSLANYYQARHQWAEALPLYRKAFEIRPDSPGAFNGHVEAVRRLQGDAAVVDVCDTKTQQDPRFFAAHLQRARSYERLGKLDKALEEYAAVLRAAPKGSEAWTLAQRQRDRLQPTAPN